MPVWKVGNVAVGDKYIIAETMVGAIQKFNRLEEESFRYWMENDAETDMEEEEYKEMMKDPPEFDGWAIRAEYFVGDGEFV